MSLKRLPAFDTLAMNLPNKQRSPERNRNGTSHVQGERPSKPQSSPSLGLTVPELLFEAGKQWQATEDLLREATLRCRLCLPTSEQEEKWFNEEVSINNSDFIERLYTRLNIGSEICKYCGGSGYDPYYNHDTTMKPCPKCSRV